MFTKILIANRGEIACRVIRTARRLGVQTVAVYSDADKRAMHVALADEAVQIGSAPVGESYLRGDRIIAAAKATGAEAIHPGYGFLSENPDFVEQVEKAGLVFIGPSSTAIRAMGLKDAAKRLMEKAGVPVVPGYHGEAQEIVVLATKAREIGYPVLIKARAGGGGKGMRKVEHPDDFTDALSAARREAKAAFGDERVLVEKYVDKPRHIEVQVFGDSFGDAVHLFERDCSAQRRHQKVIEEAPAPGMPPEMREAMTQAAVTAAKAIGYRGAGTIEFIVDASDGLRADRFWFMEMNTRLQVEHPVTEMVTDIDLVEWQLRVAAGEPLPKKQEDIALYGHSFEARIYAEDPARGFLPAIGTLHHLRFPETQDWLRIETGVRPGDAISPYYDPMIAKLVVHGPDRKTALSRLTAALRATEIAGSITNIAFLAKLSEDEAFAAGDVDTGLIDRHQAELVSTPSPSEAHIVLAAVAGSGIMATPVDDDPFSALRGYAHHGTVPVHHTIHLGDRVIATTQTVMAPGRFGVSADGIAGTVSIDERDGTVVMEGAYAATARIGRIPGAIALFTPDGSFTFASPDPLARDAEGAAAGSLRAPMPGLVKLVRVKTGEKVTKGQPLLILEAMKMEHTIAAPQDGVVAEIASEGAQVVEGHALVRFEE